MTEDGELLVISFVGNIQAPGFDGLDGEGSTSSQEVSGNTFFLCLWFL